MHENGCAQAWFAVEPFGRDPAVHGRTKFRAHVLIEQGHAAMQSVANRDTDAEGAEELAPQLLKTAAGRAPPDFSRQSAGRDNGERGG